MDELHEIKEALIELVHDKIDCLECVHADELGEIIDCIKDLYECCYYHTLIEAMESKEYTPEEKVQIVKAAQA